MASITLLGLENDLAEQLSYVLRALQHRVHLTDSLEEAIRRSGSDIVFSTGDAPNYRELIRRLVKARRHRAVVIVNRFPENSRWLEALDLGADDYCGAPFEPVMVGWLVDSVMRKVRAAAA
jgi:DNA-binding response OmpR family regulator